MMKQGWPIILLVTLLAGWISPAYAQSPEPGTNQPPVNEAKRPAVIRAQLNAGKEGVNYNVELIGRKGEDIYYRIPGAGQAAGHATLKVNTLATAMFEFQYDEFEVFKQVNERHWADAANVIMKAIAPAIPYLDFPTNNAVEPALSAAGYLLKSGMVLQQKGGEPNNRAAAAAYAQAYQIFQQVGAAQWFERANNARLKAIQCLLAMGKREAAADELNLLPVCEEVEDQDYGLYWVVQADILYRQKEYHEALAAAVKSLIFQNKDIETFADALLLSANCYFALLEMHQARDVYYEVAKLFDQTEWSAVARRQLAIIMKNNLTKGKERANYWLTFIDAKEDMNKLVEDYLAATEKASVTNANTNATATAKSQEGKTTP